MTTLGRHIEIRGIVQGVGFRPWIYRLATEEGLAGHVRNDATGVTIEAFGSGEALDAFMRRLEGPAPPAAMIRELRSYAIPPAPADTFRIVQSEAGAERRVSIPPTWPPASTACLRFSIPRNRRYRYPFTNCTNCGPRFTIARDVPYDRRVDDDGGVPHVPGLPARVRGCEESAIPRAAECLSRVWPSADSADAGRHGRRVRGSARAVAAALMAGHVVAIKGLGGFHLACDATSSEAVQRLRARKRRDEKPFAVMVRNLAACRDAGRAD